MGSLAGREPNQKSGLGLPWDPFDHSEGSFRPNVKKSDKRFETCELAGLLEAPKPRKNQSRRKIGQK